MASEILQYAKYSGKMIKESAASSGTVLTAVKAAVPAIAASAYFIDKAIRGIMNNNKKKAIFEALCWDPSLSKVSRDKLLEWYATINHVAPDLALDKAASRELLRQFALFGRVDIPTIKTLAETQDSISRTRSTERSLKLPW